MITKLLFLLSESFRALFRAKLPAAISSITIAIALVIFSLAYFSYVNLLGYSYKFKSKYRIEVFFHNDLATDDARELFNTILISDGIEQGEFIDKEKASRIFKKYFDKNIESMLDGAASILAVGLNYYVDAKKTPESLSIGRYAWGKDYHLVVQKRLKTIGKWLEQQRPACRWKVCVDTAPLLDKAWAEEAGLGWIGKHSNLINTKRGSWIVLGHLLCTEELIPDKPAKTLCGKCQECIKACPTNAIRSPFEIDSRLCLAYHTIENRAQRLPNEITQSIGNWIAGCDICQEICPWNKKTLVSSQDPEMQPREWILKLTKGQAMNWNESTWEKKLHQSALKRIKPWMWRRNAAATHGDSGPTLSRTEKIQ